MLNPQSETLEEDIYDIQMPVTSDEPSFLWFLVKMMEEGRKFCQPNTTFFKRKLDSYHVYLVFAFIIFIIAIVVGSIYLNDCSNERMICIFLIVQGVCGVFVVLVHIIAVLVDCNRINTIGPLKLGGSTIKCIFAFTYCLVIFSIIWFVIGHVWIFRKLDVSKNGQSCKTNVTKVSRMILIYEYIIGIWYMGSRIWNNQSVLCWFQNIIQHRLDRMGQSNILQIITSSDDTLDELTIRNEPSRTRSVENKTKIYVVCIVIGLILCGIPLVVMISSDSTIPSAVAIVLPTQCSVYTTDTDSTRLVTYSSCCSYDYNRVSGWYRFMGNGGTRLVTTPLYQTNICGTNYPGWWNGTLPMTYGSSNVGNICFYDGRSSCSNPLTPIIATNCGAYYVFYLPQIACCGQYRYCTTL